MSEREKFKRTGYCGKFLTVRENLSTPEEEFVPSSKRKLKEIYESLVSDGKFQKDDMEWHNEGGIFSIPASYLTRYKFGLTDDEIKFVIEQSMAFGVECTSGVTFDQNGILIASSLKMGNIFQKKDLVLAQNLAHGFNQGNRICVMRINAHAKISFDILTYINLYYPSESIADLCYYQATLANSFIMLILNTPKSELSESQVSFSLRKNLGLAPNSRISLSSTEAPIQNYLHTLKEMCEKKGLWAVISNDKQAFVIKTELETRKSNLPVTLFLSFSCWPNSLSMYCEVLELDGENLDGFKFHLGLGSSVVFNGNQSVEFIGNNLGASNFLFIPENEMSIEIIVKNIELLFGFIEYQLDILEQS